MRTLLVFGHKEFRITIPSDARITFGPFSPPSSGGGKNYERSDSDKRGTLRIYKAGSQTDILGVFSGVNGFRDISEIEYEEKVAVEEGSVVWKSDTTGYKREEKVKQSNEWKKDGVKLLHSANKSSPARKKK